MTDRKKEYQEAHAAWLDTMYDLFIADVVVYDKMRKVTTACFEAAFQWGLAEGTKVNAPTNVGTVND